MSERRRDLTERIEAALFDVPLTPDEVERVVAETGIDLDRMVARARGSIERADAAQWRAVSCTCGEMGLHEPWTETLRHWLATGEWDYAAEMLSDGMELPAWVSEAERLAIKDSLPAHLVLSRDGGTWYVVDAVAAEAAALEAA